MFHTPKKIQFLKFSPVVCETGFPTRGKCLTSSAGTHNSRNVGEMYGSAISIENVHEFHIWSIYSFFQLKHVHTAEKKV